MRDELLMADLEKQHYELVGLRQRIKELEAENEVLREQRIDLLEQVYSEGFTAGNAKGIKLVMGLMRHEDE